MIGRLDDASAARIAGRLLAAGDDEGTRQQIVIDCSNHTSRPGIFAAGDVTDVYAEQVLICIGEGAKAALSAYEYLLSL